VSYRASLLQELDAAYRDFRNAVSGLDERTFDRKWLDKRWGVREIVAHLTGWHGTLSSGLQRMARGEKATPEGEDWSDTQSYNDTFAEHAKGKTRDEVLYELEMAVEHLTESANKLPDDRFADGKTAARILDSAGISHFREHAAMVREWRKRAAA
jgi:hypothetical protein